MGVDDRRVVDDRRDLGRAAVAPVVALLRPAVATTDADDLLDDEAVELAKRGDPYAWERAYLRYGSGLLGFLVLRLGDREDGAEALSETFLRAIAGVGAVRGDAVAFRAWLFSIARNVATDRLRARSRTVVGVDVDADLVDLFADEPGSQLIVEEDALRVRQAFLTLGPDDREVVWLRVCAGLPSADVAAIVGKRAGAVRMQQQRALATMAQRMGL